MNFIRVLWLKYREWLLLSQIETTQELADAHEHRAALRRAEHRANLRIYHDRLRRVRQEIALKGRPIDLNQAIKNWRTGL
jgi:predicted DNA binding CopG/RHH family protein